MVHHVHVAGLQFLIVGAFMLIWHYLLRALAGLHPNSAALQGLSVII